MWWHTYFCMAVVSWFCFLLTGGAAQQPTQAKKLDETIAELREAIRLRPQSDSVRNPTRRTMTLATRYCRKANWMALSPVSGKP
jgi:hypothetical protein